MANWDESKHPRDDDGKFGSGDSVTPASELQKKSTDELVKINPWDDEKTRKMKMRLAKMHQGNQAIKDDITKRRAHIEEMKRDIAKVAATLPAACTAHEDGGAGAARWFQTFPPYGRYPVGGTVKGAREDAVFVFDEAAAKAILDDFRAKAKRPDWPGLLVDREHFSNDPEKTSDAMAWARDIRQDADGSIWTRWEFTPEGEKLWSGKVLVSRSPLFLSVPAKGGREYRPVALESIGMTNTPHFRELSTLAAAREAAEVTTHEGEIQMEEILKALGLAEDASPADAVAAVEALKQKASAAESAAAEAEKERDDAVAECRKVQADAFIAANRDRIADEAKCREIYVKDPELATAMLAACKAPAKEPGQKVLAAATAKTPAREAEATRAAARQTKVNEYMSAHQGVPFHVAWSACRAADPELFND